MSEYSKLDKYVIIIAFISSFSFAFISNAVSIALPAIALEFHMSNIMQNWIVTIFLLVLAAASVPFGKICGKYGLRRTYLWGIFIYIFSALMSGLSPNETILFIARIIQGIGTAILSVNVMALITAQVSPKKRGQAIGINVTGVYIGLTIAPTISGIISHNIGWRWIIYITIPLMLIVLYLLLRIDKEWFIDADKSLDVKGSALYMFGIILLLYGFTILYDITGILITIAALIILVLFTRYELRISNPVYDIKLFKNSKFISANIASLISYFATFVVTYILNYHFQYLEGLNAQTTGIILIFTPLLMAIFSPFSGKLSDKIDPQILAAIGMAIVSVALFGLCFLNENTPMYLIIISMILQGIGFGLFSSPNNNVIMGSVDKKDIGTASASTATVRSIGQSFSLGLLTLVFAIVMGNVPIEPSNYNLLVTSSQITMIISTILCVLAVILSLIGLKSDDVLNR